MVAAFLAAAYWFAWRPLPETSGSIRAPISAPGTITRDALGVPHIQAATWEDAIVLQGYAMAQDRLWQMDGMRRQAAGELSEVAGPVAIQSDDEARRLRLRRIAEEQAKALSPGDLAVLAAFARGVNAFIDTHRDRLPLEFSLLRYDPRPWTVRDSLLAGLEMYRTLTPSWRAEMIKQRMIAEGDRDKVEFLLPPRASGSPQPGSNAWAISGARSATGKPILSNDPHLEYSIPSPWYLVHLRAPGLDVAGATIVGLPAVIVGHNQRIAWGVTNLEFDVEDLYREQIDLESGRYLYQGQPQQATPERDMIAVRGQAPRGVLTWVTRHGPIFLVNDGRAYSMRWTAADVGPAGLTYPFLDLDRAGNWDEFRAVLARYAGPGQNFVYADVDGNIGSQVTGRLPVRKNCSGDVPVDGSAGECEWQGYIPFDRLPRSFNPESGIIASGNNDPFPADWKESEISGNFASPYRVRQVLNLLGSREKWKPEEMIGVQRDVYSGFHKFLADQVVAAFDRSKPSAAPLAEADNLLRNWNGQMEAGQPAPMIAVLVYEQLRKLAADRASTGSGEFYVSQMAPSAIETLLRERPQAWFPDYDALLMRCLTGAINAGVRLQGSNLSHWDYGEFLPLRIANPVEGRIPYIGRFFNLGPVPMRGSPNSVLQYTGRLGPSLRMTVDLANLDHSFINLVTGESGHRLSAHYRDQWNAYYKGSTFLMQFGKVDSKQMLIVNPSN